MNAPDKIYVTIDRPEERVEHNPELVGVAWSKKDKSCEHIEYIRKEAILEWASKMKEQADAAFAYGEGFLDALDMLTVSINSI